jgi:P63C domain
MLEIEEHVNTCINFILCQYMLDLLAYMWHYADMKLNFEDKPNDGRVRSGQARMSKLNPKERSELAKKAAAARWESVGKEELRYATHMGEIRLAEGEIALPCAVLEDGTRVLTQGGFLSAIGRRGKPKNTFQDTGQGVSKVAPFLQAENLAEHISEELRAESAPIAFRLPSGGKKAWGYRADVLPKVCSVYLKARDKSQLLDSQKPTALACDILIRGLAQVGIIALVDEATGYQRDRAADALAKILEAFIAKELQPWVKTFPSDYYEQLFRLRGLQYPTFTVQRPQYFGCLTNNIVYKRLAPGVLDELKKVIPRNEDGRPTAKYFQKLTTNVGYPKLREHLGGVVAIMKLSADYGDFMVKLNKLYPPYGQQMLIPFEYDPTEDSGEGI